MKYKCNCCHAYHWEEELNTKNKYTLCCANGKIKLKPMNEPPIKIKELLLGETNDGKMFMKFPRIFNLAVSFCSISCNNTLENSISHKKITPSLRINGEVNHGLGSIYRNDNDPVRNMQAYFACSR